MAWVHVFMTAEIHYLEKGEYKIARAQIVDGFVTKGNTFDALIPIKFGQCTALLDIESHECEIAEEIGEQYDIAHANQQDGGDY